MKIVFENEFLHQLANYFEFNGLSPTMDCEENARELAKLIYDKYPNLAPDGAIHAAIVEGARNIPVRANSHPRRDHDALLWAYAETERLLDLYGD